MPTVIKQLQNDVLRFVLDGARSKIPIEKKWQTESNYRWNEKKLQEWIAHSGNFGVATGYGCLLVSDCDGKDNQVEQIMDVELPHTLKIRTGGGGSQFYFFCPTWKGKSQNIRKENRSPVEIKWLGTQVIAPTCIHPNGNTYVVENDVPIATITAEQLKFVLRDYLSEEFKEDVVETQQNTYGSNITDIIDTKSFVSHGDEMQGSHPVHGSNGGSNFCVNQNKNTWHCFRCSSGGSVASWIAVKEGLIRCDEAKRGKIKGGLWQKVCQIARTKYNLTIAQSKGIDTELDMESFGFVKDGVVYEEVWNPETNEYGFLHLNSEQPKMTMEVDGFVPMPPTSKMISGNVITLPTTAEPYEDELSLVNEIQEHIKRYLDVEKDHLINASYYIMLTWVYDKFNTLPYLRALGDTGSGKSRYLKVIGDLAYHRTETSGAVTPAVIFRIAEKTRGTLIIDEADRSKSDTTDEVVKILNCGFEKGKFVLRCDKDNPNDIEIHNVFSPKIISSRQTFYDKALESRCITTIMKQTIRKDIPYVLGDKYEKESTSLRNKLLMYRLKNWGKIVIDSEENEALIRKTNIEPRLKQICSSLIALFPNLTAKEQFMTYMVSYNKELVEERAGSWEGQIVNTIFELMNEEKENMTCLDIANVMNENTKSEEKKVTPRKIATVLKSLGIHTKKERFGKEVNRYLTLTSCGELLELLKARYVTDDSCGDVVDCDDSLGESLNRHKMGGQLPNFLNIQNQGYKHVSSQSSHRQQNILVTSEKIITPQEIEVSKNTSKTPSEAYPKMQEITNLLNKHPEGLSYANMLKELVDVLRMLPEEAQERIGYLVSKGIIHEPRPDKFMLLTLPPRSLYPELVRV